MGSSPTVRTILAALALASCSAPPETTIDVAVIGSTPKRADPDRVLLAGANRVLADATAMGLVALDARGQVEPALAESWIVTDDGLSTIFRIHRLRWPDGREVTSDEVAASLQRAVAGGSRNRLKPLLSAVDAVIAMTGRVVEVRLRAARPQLLELLAQPELGIRRRGEGLGPWRIASGGSSLTVLRPAAPDADDIDPDNPPPQDKREIRLRGARVGLAIARFMEGESLLVLGGTLADWPVVEAAQVRASRIRVDPAEGLFGLAATTHSDFIQRPELRDALSMA
ncbi:MAG: ABC transporter substrate-binding protein, partial [Sphingomonadaceae bacterium]|nr:ABC transporter substrate-binding protein [Sphingomonadaceae bacterium]